MCLVKLLTSQFGGFPFRKLHCDAFDDAKTKPRTKAPPSPNRGRSQRKKKPFPELTGNLHSRGHSPCTTMRDAVCKVFFFFLFFSFSDRKRKKKWVRVRRDCFPSPWVTRGWWNAGGDLRRAGWEKTAISHIAGGAAEDFSNKRRQGVHGEDR